MTYSEVLTQTFCGIVINDDVKAKDGSTVGFISPILNEVAESILQWKKDKAFKNAYDGNLPFTFSRFGNGSTKELHRNAFVEFQVRCNNRGLPEAYNVKVATSIVTQSPAFKPMEAKPVTIPEPTPSNLVEAVKAAMDEMDEDDFVSIDELTDDDYDLIDEYDDDDNVGIRKFTSSREK